MKFKYPGDKEFTLDEYPLLPFDYVVIAVENALNTYSQTLHDLERPVALLSSLQANSGRDPKKQRKPFGYLDFSFYKPRAAGNLPDHAYGSSYLMLIRNNKLPAWALFCYKDLASCAEETYFPEEPAFIAKDALILHPRKVPGGYQGMLIAMESASNCKRKFTTTDGKVIELLVPMIESKFVAKEGETLTIR